jgi:outer membrane protein W
MIKVILTTVLLSVAYLSIHAQTLSIGPVIGANLSTISESENGERLLGLSAGAFANYSINENLGLNVKVLFSQMGVASSVSDNKVRLNYLQIPLSGVYFFGETGDKFRPKVFLGPYVGFLLGAKNGDLDIKELLRSVDIGGQIGLGFNYSLKERTWLNVDLGYAAGFTTVADADDAKGKNNALFANVGLSFPIGGN